MNWFIGIAVVVLIIFLLNRGKKKEPASVGELSRSAQTRAEALPEAEREELSAEVRTLALEQYEMATATAVQAGKSDSIAHQVGVLRAASAVLVRGAQVDLDTERELQMETIPFNKQEPSEGGAAVSEYLVYKFFPEQADESLFSEVLGSFKHIIFSDAEEHPDADSFVFEMIYCVKYDWQKYIANMPE